ncbi:MAG: Flp pilus assembly complex ATPase component TadA, partial [Elusimicrobia bacterium]|nr:Flp pilus assembly complex ATPase component TadA [Elusimicrobiota bacterium]
MSVSMEQLFRLMFEKKASDLHLHAASPPVLRINGEMRKVNSEALSEKECKNLIYSILTDKQKEQFEENYELDLAFSIKDIGRVRMNVYQQRGAVCSSMRAIPSRFFTFEELCLPSAVNEIVDLPVGLVLVSGPTGSGKTTTLASIINY